MTNRRIYRTKFDGFIIVCTDKTTKAYEGKALCPQNVQRWLEKNNPIELDAFWLDAISYGYAR